MTHTCNHLRSSPSFREARLCFQDGPRGNPEERSNVPSPEQPGNKHMEAVYTAIVSIANTDLPLVGQAQVNVLQLRVAIEAARKTNNPLVIKRLDDLQKQAMANSSLRPLLIAVGTGQPIPSLSDAQRKDILDFVEQQQGQNKVSSTVEKTNIEQQRFKELRGKLAKLEMEVKRANTIKDSKEKVAHMKEQQEAIRLLLRSVEPSVMQAFGRETRVPDLTERLEEMLSTDVGEQARKRLLEGLQALNSGTSFQQYVSEEGIMKVARNIVGSDLTRNILDGLRERGFTVQAETVVNFLFGAIRGFAANAFATSKWFNAMPELRARGRQYHYRIVLEAHLRTENAHNQSTPLNFIQMLAQSTADLELLAMPVAANRVNIKRDWNALYEAWRTVAQGQRQNNMSAPIPPVPIIAQAADMAGAGQKYLASINQIPQQQQNNAPTENTQPRAFNTLTFTPPQYSIDVVPGQLFTVTINGTRLQFQKNNDGHLQVRIGDDNAPFRTFFDGNVNTRITSLTLRAPTANIADLEMRSNGRDQGVRLSTLQEQATTQANRTNTKIIFATPTTLQFAA